MIINSCQDQKKGGGREGGEGKEGEKGRGEEKGKKRRSLTYISN